MEVWRNLKMLWLLLVLLGVQTEAINPGIKVKITKKGLDYGKQVGMKFLKSTLMKMPIPDYKGTQRVPIMGTMTYSMTGVQIKDISFGESSIVLVPSSKLNLSVGPTDVEVQGDWSMKVSFIHDNEKINLKLKGMMLNAVVEVGWNATRRLSLSLANCRFQTKSVDINFQGRSSWMYKLFIGSAKNSIRQALDSKACDGIRKVIATLERKLHEVPEYSHINSLADFDYSIVAAPVITNNSIEVDFKSEFYSALDHLEAPESPAPFSLPELTDRMLVLGVSDFVPNTAALIYYRAGALSWNLTDSKIPQSFATRLNTGSFKSFAPELQKQFPNTPVVLKIFARHPPRVWTQSGSLHLMFPGAVQAFVQPKRSSEVPVFLLHVDANITAQVFVSGKNIGANLTMTDCGLSLVHSEVKNFSVNKLKNLMDVALKSAILPQINRKFNKGYPLPTLFNTSLHDPVINIQEGFLTIATDILYGA
ncbi:bactericidal permeability-increasing protein-like [Sminthopsis crassicaudata]|uniref:bactericidal permeability-increasing protein-like n=1 Tax=Sminthopsis crassicaudata TaxID=9301 RepID=UPI003D68A534